MHTMLSRRLLFKTEQQIVEKLKCLYKMLRFGALFRLKYRLTEIAEISYNDLAPQGVVKNGKAGDCSYSLDRKGGMDVAYYASCMEVHGDYCHSENP